ncbi:glycosyl transferase family 2 [Desulfotomaculum nigrificans CO-1-SRB]|uniref:Glycosyl transferase family 2 n=1 Tax=Desulfotomaculum nigrificans (strain DSM 14880 / VKM B-2319 / CO-1-SRB) TaxID=868595 RepID=F6B7D6_DESCC|nr:glycosyl transferase family 2 [Desulfotomaculum nigrificans CO-1-SRB]
MVSIIIPCKNEGKLIEQTIRSIIETPTEVAYDITVVNDGSTDGCCAFLQGKRNPFPGVRLINTTGIGSANARNLGVQQADGDVLVFCDAHITVEPGWLEALTEGVVERGAGAVSPGVAAMTKPSAIGYGMTWNKDMEARWLPSPGDITEVPIAPGGCVAVRREVFNDVGGFERGFRVYGYEDAEFSLRLWLFGYRVEVDPSVVIYHYFRTSHPYPITMQQYAYNALRMAVSHFNSRRIGRVIDIFADLDNIGRLVSEVIFESDALEQRRRYFSRRRYDDDWFMDKFTIPL